MNRKKFRESLNKLMPGYNWTVHRQPKGTVALHATGIQSSGSNRLSTLQVIYQIRNETGWFEVAYSGYGVRAPWLGKNADATLARALRGLQDHFEHKANRYIGAAGDMARGRITRSNLMSA